MTINEHIACPFSGCVAMIDLAAEMTHPGPSAGATRRIPQHITTGNEWFGVCPASLHEYPLTARAREDLLEQATALARQLGDKERPTEHGDGKMAGKPHVLHPRPSRLGGNGFVSSTAPRERPTEPEWRRPKLEILRPKGGAVASVAEVRNAIARANVLIAEAQAAQNQTVADKLSEATALLNYVRQDSTDPLGIPQLNIADDKSAEIVALCATAIELNETYASTL